MVGESYPRRRACFEKLRRAPFDRARAINWQAARSTYSGCARAAEDQRADRRKRRRPGSPKRRSRRRACARSGPRKLAMDERQPRLAHTISARPRYRERGSAASTRAAQSRSRHGRLRSQSADLRARSPPLSVRARVGRAACLWLRAFLLMYPGPGRLSADSRLEKKSPPFFNGRNLQANACTERRPLTLSCNSKPARKPPSKPRACARPATCGVL